MEGSSPAQIVCAPPKVFVPVMLLIRMVSETELLHPAPPRPE